MPPVGCVSLYVVSYIDGFCLDHLECQGIDQQCVEDISFLCQVTLSLTSERSTLIFLTSHFILFTH